MDVTRRQFIVQSAAFAASLELLLAKSSQLVQYDALGIAELIRKKEITALEAVDDVLRRIEQVNPKIHAVLTDNFEFEKARARAKNLRTDTAKGSVCFGNTSPGLADDLDLTPSCRR